VKIEDSGLRPDTLNANEGTQRGLGLLDKSLRKLGAGRSILVDKDGNVIAGNKTLERAADIDLPVRIIETDGKELIAVKRTDLDLYSETDKRARQLAYADNKVAELDLAWKPEQIALDFAPLDLGEWGFEAEPETKDAEPQIDRAAELNEKWKVVTGDLWQIGEHRLLCGDSTKREDVDRVMGGEKAILCHADPPYGMGKENEGIENDNLYREKLDAFQMDWWKACRPSLENNASIYIWGNAEDLWRLWYRGLKDSERLTFRNEITWDKSSGQGMGASDYRMYAMASERCLFFVIGEQGYNNNADNYFDGWTPIVEYLEHSRQLMNWSIKDTKRIAGHSEHSGCHWFDKSQWSMPTEETYKAWQLAASGDAFKREYDDLKREFYATRAPFNNTHELMTDVWKFETMRGDDRPDHPTPKPPEMVQRIIHTSGLDELPTLDPFCGSGTTMVACENLRRKCRAIEISPNYCAVILERMNSAFPDLQIERLIQNENSTP
jgi:DNA modification methylase